MALTPEQEAEILRAEVREERQHTEIQRQRKLEAVRLAKELIQENRRLALANSVSDVTAKDLTDIADEIISYINN